MILLKQIKLSINQNRYYTIWTLVLLILCMTLLIVSISEYSKLQNQYELIKDLSDKNYYNLYDNYIGQEESIFMNEKDNLSRLKKFYLDLKESKSFTYFSMMKQPIYIQNIDVGDQFLYGYENNAQQKGISICEGEDNYSAFKSIQIEKDAIEYFGLEIIDFDREKLPDWDTADFHNVPIILGWEYYGTVSLGEKFRINYLGTFTNVEVIGFLKPNSNLVNMGEMENIDRYIIFPSLILDDPTTEEEKAFQIRLYFQKLSGTIVTKLSPNTVQTEINDICLKNNLNTFFVEGSTNAMQIFKLEANKFVSLFLGLSVVLMLLSCIVFAFTITLKVKKQIEVYSIHLICGAKLNDIYKYVFVEIYLLSFIAFVLALFLAYVLSSQNIVQLPISLSCCLLTGLIVSIYPIYIIRKNLNKNMRRNY